MPPFCGWGAYAAPSLNTEELLSGFSCRSGFTFCAFFTVVLATMLASVLGMLVGFLAFFSSGGSSFRSGGSSSRCSRSSSFLSERRSGNAHQGNGGKSCEQTTRNHFLNLQYNQPEFFRPHISQPSAEP